MRRDSPALGLGLPPMKEFTPEELACCTGEDGQPALIAAHGLVYDVSNSYHWRKAGMTSCTVPAQT
jgi:predicted heme/steroid binding protein